MRRYIWLIAILAIANITVASALPEILDGFNIKYKTFKTRIDKCDLCHISNNPQGTIYENEIYKNENDLNPYGMAIKRKLNRPMDQTFNEIENLDSDGDKFKNVDEIRKLTKPGDKKDYPKPEKIKMEILDFDGDKFNNIDKIRKLTLLIWNLIVKER